MFRAVDANGSGDVDAAEFSEWLLHDTKEDLRWRPMKRRFEDAGGAAIGKLGWVELFKRYDTDRSGELDFGEFCTVRCPFPRIPSPMSAQHLGAKPGSALRISDRTCCAGGAVGLRDQRDGRERRRPPQDVRGGRFRRLAHHGRGGVPGFHRVKRSGPGPPNPYAFFPYLWAASFCFQNPALREEY